MMPATLLISSRNYSSWSLRGWLLARLSGLDFEVKTVAADDASALDELLLRASSIRVPCLQHDGATVWDTLAIAEYLHDVFPKAGLLPRDRLMRAYCRSIAGEMHSGFGALRSSLPMNLRARRSGFVVWSAAQADIDRIVAIWDECLGNWGGPWLMGARPTVADAMYAPVATRFRTYGVALSGPAAAYAAQVLAWPEMRAWEEEAVREPDLIQELEGDF